MNTNATKLVIAAFAANLTHGIHLTPDLLALREELDFAQTEFGDNMPSITAAEVVENKGAQMLSETAPSGFLVPAFDKIIMPD